jgi:hypothetical protein
VLAELIVTVLPAPSIDKFPVPASFAAIAPPLNANDPGPAATVKVPDPVTFPPLTVRFPSVLLNVSVLKLPPDTVMFAVAASRLFALTFKLPPETVRFAVDNAALALRFPPLTVVLPV